MSIKSKIISLINAGNEVTGLSDTNLTDVIRSLIEGYHGITQWYPHYKSHLSAIDGLYSGFNYTNVYVIGNELVVGFLAKKHHFTEMSEQSQIFRVARMNLTTGVVTETDTSIVGMGYCGSVYYNGTYYIFDSFRHRYSTTDWSTFSQPVTYTLPSGVSEPYYITVGDNGRFISTTSKSVSGSMLYSDDLGLTWSKATGGNNVLTDHGGTCKVGNTLVAYCQNATGGGDPTSDTPRRYVLTSTDNGATWAEQLCSNEDLAHCGGSHASGDFCNIGDDWFYVAGKRLQYTDNDGIVHLGTIQLFKGTAQDVINGSMSLYKVIDDLSTGCTSIVIPTSTTWTDTGNLGIATDGSKIYCAYMRPLFHIVQGTGYNISNCMVALSIVDNNSQGTDSADDYYSSSWETERANEEAARDRTHDFFIYTDDTEPDTNYLGTIYTHATYNKMRTGYCQPSEDISIPFTSYFELGFVGALREVLDSGNSYLMAYFGANIGGQEVSITGTTNNLHFPKTNTTIGAGSISAKFSDDLLFKLKYQNGVISATLNGITINNLKSRSVYEINTNTNTILLKCKALADVIAENTSQKSGVIKSFWVDTDGDLTGITGYTVTNNLTNVTNSNSSKLLERGASYSATLTSTGVYSINSVVITMGGVDVTSTVYSNGTINIQSVTGNLVITAAATPTAYSITNSLTHCTSTNSATSVYDGDSYSATLTADAGYAITSVAITMGGVDVTGTSYSGGTITIANVTGNIVITAVATERQATLVSIDAVFTQGQAVIYDTDSLETLKQYLVVTAYYDDTSSEVLGSSAYTLSGTLTTGTSTITASYGGETDTFTVSVTHYDNSLYNWDFTQGLVDSKQSATAVLGSANVSQSSSGLTWTTGSGSYVYLANMYDYRQSAFTIELDVTSIVMNSNNDNRMLNLSDNTTGSTGYGFLYRDNNWKFNHVSGSPNPDSSVQLSMDEFDGTTLKIQIDYPNKDVYVYADNVLVATYTDVLFKNGSNGRNYITLGTSTQTSSLQTGSVITGARIYAGLV